jgi:hypothetical protein
LQLFIGLRGRFVFGFTPLPSSHFPRSHG